MKKVEGKKKSIFKRPSPSVLVVGTASAVVLAVACANIFGAVGGWRARKHPKVEYVDSAPASAAKARGGGERVVSDRPLFDGEVFNTSERVGEAAALASGAVLVASVRGAEYGVSHGGDVLPGLPADHRELLRAMEAAKALPQGMSLGEDFTLASRTSVISVRYRRDPLSVEVVSVARERSWGPAIIMRMPDELAGAGPGVRYYMAQSLNAPELPQAFAPVSSFARAGWLPQEYRAEAATAEQLRAATRRLEEERVEVEAAVNGGVKK